MPEISRRTALARGGQAVAAAAVLPVISNIAADAAEADAELLVHFSAEFEGVKAPSDPPSEPSSRTEVHQRFVSMDGNDNNDGVSWDTAKKTIEAAVLSLPMGGGRPGNMRHAGNIDIAAGTYVTSQTIECNEDIRFRGAGASIRGTLVKLGHSGHCFAPTDDFTDYAHGVQFENLAIEGWHWNEAQTITGPYDLIRLYRPGFQTVLRNVRLDRAPRHGIFIIRAAVNFHAYNVTGNRCVESFLTFNVSPSGNVNTVSLFGCQVDNCGQYPIRIIDAANGRGVFSVYSLKTETSVAGLHESVIAHDPIGGSNGMDILVDGLFAWSRQGGNPSVLRELTGSGSPGWWNWRNVIADGYDNTFQSDKTGVSHENPGGGFLGMVGRSKWHEFRLGAIAIMTGTAAPSNSDGRPDGSVFFRTNGEMWRKISGVWVRI